MPKPAPKPAIQIALSIFGNNQAAIAREMDTSRSSVNRWVAAGLVPPGSILKLAAACRKRCPSKAPSIERFLRDYEVYRPGSRNSITKRG